MAEKADDLEQALWSMIGALAAHRARSSPPSRAADDLHRLGDGWLMFDWLARQGVDPNSCVVTEVRGDDMAPTIPSGSAILVHQARREPRDAGVFLLRTDSSERPVVRRLRRGDKGAWLACGDNPLSPEEPTSRLKLIGQVLWSAQEFAECREPYEPRAVYMLFAKQVESDALVQAARDIPIEALHGFALEEARHAEERYAGILAELGTPD